MLVAPNARLPVNESVDSSRWVSVWTGYDAMQYSEKGNGNGRKHRSLRIAPRGVARLSAQRAVISWEQPRAACASRGCSPLSNGSSRVEFSRARSDPPDQLFPAVSASPLVLNARRNAGESGGDRHRAKCPMASSARVVTGMTPMRSASTPARTPRRTPLAMEQSPSP